MPSQGTEGGGTDPGTVRATGPDRENRVEPEVDRRASDEGRFVVPVVAFARGGTNVARLARGAARAARAVGWAAASAGEETVA